MIYAHACQLLTVVLVESDVWEASLDPRGYSWDIRRAHMNLGFREPISISKLYEDGGIHGSRHMRQAPKRGYLEQGTAHSMTKLDDLVERLLSQSVVLLTAYRLPETQPTGSLALDEG